MLEKQYNNYRILKSNIFPKTYFKLSEITSTCTRHERMGYLHLHLYVQSFLISHEQGNIHITVFICISQVYLQIFSYHVLNLRFQLPTLKIKMLPLFAETARMSQLTVFTNFAYTIQKRLHTELLQLLS